MGWVWLLANHDNSQRAKELQLCFCKKGVQVGCVSEGKGVAVRRGRRSGFLQRLCGSQNNELYLGLLVEPFISGTTKILLGAELSTEFMPSFMGGGGVSLDVCRGRGFSS